VNLTNVRSATKRRLVATVLAAGALLCAAAAPARAQLGPEVTVAVMPPETTIGELATVPDVALGVMSTGIGDVPAEQTYLDISQGNRVADSLYDGPLPPLESFFFRVRHWNGIVRRADGAPAEIVPGLLSSSLLAAGIQFEAAPGAESASLVAARRDGSVARAACCGVSVISAGVGTVRRIEGGLRGGDLLIVFAEPEDDKTAGSSPRIRRAPMATSSPRTSPRRSCGDSGCRSLAR
jgi:hypothetical protein